VTAASRPVLEVMTASTRPGRVGRAFADWFIDVAAQHGVFDVVDADLAVVALPFLDEPHHPKLGRYVHEHTKQWSGTVSRADAFVFVTPEYNYGYSAVLRTRWTSCMPDGRTKPSGSSARSDAARACAPFRAP
jgi:hypothetical protein